VPEEGKAIHYLKLSWLLIALKPFWGQFSSGSDIRKSRIRWIWSWEQVCGSNFWSYLMTPIQLGKMGEKRSAAAYCKIRNTVRDVLCSKLKRTVDEVPRGANCLNWCAEEWRHETGSIIDVHHHGQDERR
jgi:hypothetical protein